MSLTDTWLEAETSAGKSQQQAMADMNKATGYKVNYVQILRWRNGERSPRPKARAYLLKKALPYLFAKPGKRDLMELVNALL